MKTIEVRDWADKHTTFILSEEMKPLGRVHQDGPSEWQAFGIDGQFIDWFTSKSKAKAALV